MKGQLALNDWLSWNAINTCLVILIWDTDREIDEEINAELKLRFYYVFYFYSVFEFENLGLFLKLVYWEIIAYFESQCVNVFYCYNRVLVLSL